MSGPKQLDLTGMKFGAFTVLDKGEKKGYHQKWICKCDCGIIKEVFSTTLRNKENPNCGCSRKTHGESYSPLYRVWVNMKSRCNNPNAQYYSEYGGRNITYCKEWENYENFSNWAKENGYQKGLELDRIDNNRNYSPENCRFTTRYISQRNKRSHKNSSSQYVGVSYVASRERWYASIKVNNSNKTIGIYKTELEAAKAREEYINSHNLRGYTKNFV